MDMRGGQHEHLDQTLYVKASMPLQGRMPMSLIWMSVLAAGACFSMAESKIFAPVRAWVEKRNRFMGEAFACGYCLAHWCSAAIAAIVRPDLGWNPVVNYLVAVLTVTWLASLQWAVMCSLLKLAGK